MGAWSAGIFGNDTSSDVRDNFRFWIGEGLSAEAATEKVLADCQQELEIPEAVPDIWLGLAAAQAQCGRLLESVKERALAIIESGEDLERWRDLTIEDDPALIRKRAAALEKLKTSLTDPPRKPMRIRKTYVERTDWEIGHAIAYRLLSGKWAIIRVIQHYEGRYGDRLAIVELCDWTGAEIPPADVIQHLSQRASVELPDQIQRLRDMAAKEGMSEDEFSQYMVRLIDWDNKFCVHGNRDRDPPSDRVQVIATGLSVRRTDDLRATFFGGWPELDDYLQRVFGLD